MTTFGIDRHVDKCLITQTTTPKDDILDKVIYEAKEGLIELFQNTMEPGKTYLVHYDFILIDEEDEITIRSELTIDGVLIK